MEERIEIVATFTSLLANVVFILKYLATVEIKLLIETDDVSARPII